MTTRSFDLSDVLSITTGALVSTRHVDGVYDILGYMTGESLFTHQLPRAAVACAPALLEQHHALAGIAPPEWDKSGDMKAQVHAWVDLLRLTYGSSLPVTPLAEWRHIDPVQELVEITERPDRIVVVAVGAGQAE